MIEHTFIYLAIQLLTSLVYPIHYLFNSGWFVVAFILLIAATLNYCLKKYSREIKDDIGQSLAQMKEAVVSQADSGINSIKNCLADAGDDLQKEPFKKMGIHFKNHSLGIGLCLKTVYDSETLPQVASEIGKIGSMIGLEQSIVNKVVGLVASKVRPAPQPNLQYENLDDIEKMIPILSSALAVGGVEIGKAFNGDLPFEKYLDRFARNTKNSQIILKHCKEALQSAGLIEDQRWSLLHEISIEVATLKEEFTWISRNIAHNGAEFLRNTSYTRVRRFKTQLDNLSSRLRVMNQPEIRNNQIFVEINRIILKSEDLLSQVEQIRECNGIRPVPVGVCFQGPSQIGKSTLIEELLRRVKVKLRDRPDLFPDVDSWSSWNMNQRDEFDSGYVGQEIVHADDAFQDKQNKDHLMWYQYISPNRVGTNQAAVDQKGSPFRALLCVSTCNQLPTTSIAVQQINALWERFPVTVRTRAIRAPSKAYDMSFSHLEFEQLPMKLAVNSCNSGNKVTLDEIAIGIAERIVDNYIIFNEKLATLRTVGITHQQESGSESESEPESLNEDEWEISEPEEEVEVPSSGEDFPDMALRLSTHHVVTANWNHFSKSMLNDLMIVLQNAEEPDPATAIGPWIDYLVERDPLGKQRPCKREDIESPWDFVTTLGRWVIRPGAESEFWPLFLQQPTLRLKSNFDDAYLWGPLFGMGRDIVLVSDQLREEIEQKLLSPFRRSVKMVTKGFRSFKDFVFSTQGVRFLSVGAMAVPALYLVPLNPDFAQYYTTVVMYHIARGSPRVPYLSPRPRLIEMVNFIPISATRLWDKIEGWVSRLSGSVIGTVLDCLEILGINVTPFWNDFIRNTGEILTAPLALLVSFVLMYLVIKIVMVLFKPAITHESVQEGHKLPAKVKTLKYKTFTRQQHLCANACDDDVECDGLEWERTCSHQDADSFYTNEYYSYIEDSFSMETTIVNLVSMNGQHVLISSEPSEDDLKFETESFSLQRFEHDLMKKRCFGLTGEFQLIGTKTELREKWEKILNTLREYNISNWDIVATTQGLETIRLSVILTSLTTTIQGKFVSYTRRMLKTLGENQDILRGNLTSKSPSVSKIVLESIEESIDLQKNLINNHMVRLSKVQLYDCDNLDIMGQSVYGMGHTNSLIAPAHFCQDGDLVRFWRHSEKPISYSLARVVSLDRIRDIAFLKILLPQVARDVLSSKGASSYKLSKIAENFRDLTTHLADEKLHAVLSDNKEVLCYLPVSGITQHARVTPCGVQSYNINNEMHTHKYMEITGLTSNVSISRNGDCGGFIVSAKDRYQSKLLGFHTGSSNSKSVGAYLIKSDLEGLRELSYESYQDRWEGLVVSGKPVDLPHGPELEFLGKFASKTKPTTSMSLEHWQKTSWSEVFEEQLQPGPLNPLDSRIEEQLPVNAEGKPTLLLKPNTEMCKTIPSMDEVLLKQIEQLFIGEYSTLIGEIQSEPHGIDDLLDEALNGNRINDHFRGLDLEKACGLPWNLLPGISKKSDLLEKVGENIAFKITNEGQRLKKRVVEKILLGNDGQRIISFSNSKLKDALVTLSAVKKGKTRVFHCIPIEKIICDSAVFGNFKESYVKAGLSLNHAIGSNAHSHDWYHIYEKITTHRNFFDVDFSRFDKLLDKDLLRSIFTIMNKVIENKVGPYYTALREVLATESIETIVVDYDTVYKTKRGNKSGEYLTTIVNCIANDILSFYAFCKAVGFVDLYEFRANVSLVTFGDDKIESVSDLYAAKYNYFSVKRIMESLGHTITPGNKEGIETEFCSLDDLVFLKRKFSHFQGLIVAPLDPRSIEGGFVWTRNSLDETEIWFNIIEASLYEAVLHGEQYFNSFKKKVFDKAPLDLQKRLSALVLTTYEYWSFKYITRYHE